MPEVAGHPAGAAANIQNLKNGKPLNFRALMHEFTPDTFTFSPFVDREAWSNRQLLRRIMMTADFAPFDGEWGTSAMEIKNGQGITASRMRVVRQREFSSS